jgi:predicted transcriptional regulator
MFDAPGKDNGQLVMLDLPAIRQQQSPLSGAQLFFAGADGSVRRAGTLALQRGPRYTIGMTSREKLIKAIQGLPDAATWEDIEECVRFLGGIHRGLADIKGGRVVLHEEVKGSLKKWLTR